MRKSIFIILIATLLAALGLGFYFNRQQIFDLISANAFSAPEEISAIKSRIKLTDNAKTIFYATHPALEQQDAFNESCKSHDEEVSVLGCYTNGRIYLYDIEDEDLDGIIESTAAHELLHAVWERMSAREKSELTTQIVNVYNDEKYHASLAEDLETYAEEERIEELHSRIGTEIAELPTELESHYAKYFVDQDYVVAFYDDYITPFRELSEEIECLSERLESLNNEIDEKTAAYYRSADQLSAEIDEFNSCVESSRSCFVSESAYYAKRNSLVAWQAELESDYEELNDLVDEYNTLVVEYNDNVIRGERLEQAINSNKQVESLE